MATVASRPPQRVIRLRKVRTHNLKEIDLELPLDHLIVVTGVSGAGKSSLAFDTLYAEGQRRYVETFSPFTRQFLEPLGKPEADQIEGVPPAIAVRGEVGRPSPWSTVGTLTGIHEELGLLFSRFGEVQCWDCGELLAPATASSVARAIDELPSGARYEVGFPLELRQESDPLALSRALLEEGFTRVRCGTEVAILTPDGSGLAALVARGEAVEVVVDRLVRGKDPIERRTDSIETAFGRGLGRCIVRYDGGFRTYSRSWRCARCGRNFLQPQPHLFRYRSRLGACPRCAGQGSVVEWDLDRIIPDRSRTIREGAIAPGNAPVPLGRLDRLIKALSQLGIPTDVPVAELTAEQWRWILEGDPASGYEGLFSFFRRRTGAEDWLGVPKRVRNWQRSRKCPDCRGARLRPEALAVRVDGFSIADVVARPIAEVANLIGGWSRIPELAGSSRLLNRLLRRLELLSLLQLDHLSLDRSPRSLSSGELRRVVMARTLGAGLVKTLFVLDEPTTGFHPHELNRLIAVLERLRDAGNTLVVVDHEPDLIRRADHILDLGPGAGGAGGQVVYSGPLSGFTEVGGSLTSDFLDGRTRFEPPASGRRPARESLTLLGACSRNLREIDVTFPLGVLCVVAGVSGSGKSALVEETLYPAVLRRLGRLTAAPEGYRDLRGGAGLDDASLLTASTRRCSNRSTPVTSVGAFDEIRRTFAETHEARRRNYDAGMFGFHSEAGRCGRCRGEGTLSIDMHFLPEVSIPCPDCRGQRYRPEVLEVTYRGRNIAEVLQLTVKEAFLFFRHRPRVQRRLRPLLDIGLEYLGLGQSARTLSGGEFQRLRLARFLAQSLGALRGSRSGSHTLLILDQPTAGLHPSDVRRLLDALGSLVESGHSVIVVEHRLELMIRADWIIELGPGPGEQGGQLVAEGTPEDVAREATPTGLALRKALRAIASSTD